MMRINRIINNEIFNDNKFENQSEEENNNENLNKKNTYNILISACYYFLKILKIFIRVSGIYLLWIFLHYFSAHLYIKFCVPDTLFGFLMSPFMIATPHCQGLRWIVYNAAGIINNMWILIGAWIYSIIWIFNRDGIEATNL